MLFHCSALLSAEERGQVFLYFGCRHRNKDFLYRQELGEFDKQCLVELHINKLIVKLIVLYKCILMIMRDNEMRLTQRRYKSIKGYMSFASMYVVFVFSI